MSIELRQAAEQVLEAFETFGEADDFASLFALTQKMNALRDALTQPATTEPVYWEWRHLSTHPDTVDFGKWSEWKRVEARSAIHTIEDALAEFRAYIARGHKYELRALYTHPAPSVPADVARNAERYRWLKDRNNKAQIGVGHWESDDHFTWLCDLDADEAIDAAMLAAKEK